MMIWNLPNTLTWLRIFAIPLVVALYYLPFRWSDPAAGLLFAIAGITDSLDGYFARKYGQTSKLGAFLDPVADKLIVAVALVLIVSKDPRWFVVIIASVIIGRSGWPRSASARRSPSRASASTRRSCRSPACR